MSSQQEIEKKIYSIFARATSSLGYSEVHGRILASLLAEKRPLSLQEISKKTNYSLGSISLSIDFLELLGVVRKFKKSGDRKIYVKLEGDLLSALKKIVILKIEREVKEVMKEFENYKNVVKEEKTKRILNALENELNKLQRYVEKLSKVKL
ncbi:MAG: hypothetical protein QXJ96_02865 [Candidatus Aenigmatarchaeota archaeon]|nr:hypothetical protein [Candidatus Aenigmarchaeota archaeon]